MPAAKQPANDGNLRQRLASLRRKMRIVTAFRGSSWVIGLVLAAAAVVGLLDWRYHLPDLVRGVALAGTLAAAVYIAYRHLIQPLHARSDDLTLALKVEEQYPHLEDALASTVQFLEREGRPDGESSALEREAVRRAMRRASDCDFGKVVDRRGVRSAGLGAAAALGAAVTLGVLFPAMAWTSFLRLADPFGGHDWPRQTQLAIEPVKDRMGRGEPFEVRGKIFGVVPQEAVVVFRFEGFPPLEHRCTIRTEDDGTGRLSTRLDPSRVQRSFRFQVKANDAVTPEQEVQVLPPPGLIAIEGRPSPQLRLYFPAYTRMPSPEDVSPGIGNVEAVTGTDVILKARADRPLSRAWIEYRPEAPNTDLAAFLSPLGTDSLWSTMALSAGGREVLDTVPGALEEDKVTFTIGFRPRVGGMYALHFEDESGLGGHRLFELRVRPDPAPVVRLDRPAPARDVLTVLPTAELPLEVVVEDGFYGARDVFLEFRTRLHEPSRRLPLFDHGAGLARLASPLAGSAGLAAAHVEVQPQRLELRRSLRLESIRHADGSTLHEGNVVVLQAAADDFDDVTPFKEPGRSHQVELRIVDRNALEVVLNQEQARIQQELLRLREKQREALQKATEVDNKLKQGEKATPDDLEKLVQSAQTQQQVRERVGNDREGLRAEVARVLDTLKQNGLESSAVRDRMHDVSREMQRLAENELETIEPKLNDARRLAELQDEKARAERRQRLEERAAQAEKDARAMEEASQRKAQEAERAQKEAAQSSDPAEKARRTEEARRERERAEELRKQAAAQKEQAQRDRKEAARTPADAQPHQPLAEAKRGQEEVEKTINDLLTRMEPWSSTREIKGEASQILEEQKKAIAETEQMRSPDKELMGKRPEELTRQQQAELDAHRERQQKLEERARQLMAKMERVAKDREEKDPQTARELKGALDEARKNDISGKMQEARQHIEHNDLNNAKEKQQESAQALQKLVKQLEDRREQELDRLAKKMRKAEKDLAELIDQQERLQKKTKEAAKMADPGQREQAMKQIAQEQEALRKKAKDLSDELARLRAGRASQSLGQADEQMQDATKQLTRGDKGEMGQEEVLDRLDEALEELEMARKQAEDELEREQMGRIADAVKRLAERQKAHNEEAERIQTQVQRSKGWSRGLKISLGRLRDAQQGLGAETKEAAEKQLGGAPVFARSLKRAAEAMDKAGERAAAMVGEPPAAGKLPDEDLGRLQGEALKRLTQVVEAVKTAAEAPQRAAKAQGGGGGGGEGSGGGGGRQGDSVPPLAQLKMLRQMQKDVNDRTDDFRRKHVALDKLTAEEKTQLQDIRRDQTDVMELLDEMKQPANEKEAPK